MKQATLAACLAGAFACPVPAFAQSASAPAAPATPSLGAVIAATPGLSLSGYLATTYTHFDTATPAQRQFDTTQNGFTLNQAGFTAAYLPASGFGASVSLLGGSDATYLPGGSQLGVENAFVQYASGPLTLMAGRLPTLAGAEVVDPAANNEISRSLLFYDLEPIYHTGLRASYAVNGALTLTGGVNEGFNHATQVRGDSKTVELGAAGSPSKMFSYSLAYYYTGTGSYWNYAPQAIASKEQLLDLVGTLNATEALSFGLNVDLASKADYNGIGSGSAKADGYALYANYAINDQYTLSGRGEYLDDKQGLVSGTYGQANKIKELTVALNYLPVSHVKLSAELRQDRSDLAIFDGGAKTRQTSFELLAAYSF